MNRTQIETWIAGHEGRRSVVYDDTVGKPTIGIGWNLDDAESQDICDHFGLNLAELKAGTAALTDAQIDEVFDYQLSEVIVQAGKLLPGFDAMPDTVQMVVCDMLFEMGEPSFSQFHETLAALHAGDWKLAAVHAGQSKWATQVPDRAKSDMQLLEAA